MPPTDRWTIDPQSLFSNMGSFNPACGGVVYDASVLQAMTPNDTPESSKDSGASEPNSDISEGVNLDIDMEWQALGGDDMLLDMSQITMETLDGMGLGDLDIDASMRSDMTADIPNWDEVHTDFSKPFELDTSLYSMNV